MGFIRRERIYIWMLFFILAVNLINVGQAGKRHHDEKGSLSAMTFEEMGITEGKVKDFFESERPSAKFFKYAIILGFFIFMASLILNIGFIFSRKKIDFKGGPYKAPISWGISDLIRASIIIIFTGYLIGIIESFMFKLFHLNIGLNLHMMLNTFFIDVAVTWVILYFVIVKYKQRLQVLGLRFGSIFNDILSGITAYIFILPLLFAALILSMWFLNLLGYSPPSQPVFEVFMEEKRTNVLLFLAILVSVFGPAVEEMFFRGFMYSAIRKRLGVLAAAFLSASIFSLLHTNIVGFLPIMVLGVLLAYLYEKTGSLVAPVAVHVIHNSIIVGFVFFIKKLI